MPIFDRILPFFKSYQEIATLIFDWLPYKVCLPKILHVERKILVFNSRRLLIIESENVETLSETCHAISMLSYLHNFCNGEISRGTPILPSLQIAPLPKFVFQRTTRPRLVARPKTNYRLLSGRISSNFLQRVVKMLGEKREEKEIAKGWSSNGSGRYDRYVVRF